MKAHLVSSLFVLGAICMAVLPGCERPADSKAVAKPPAAAPPAAEVVLPANFWLTAEPANAQPVADVRKNAIAGQEVIVFGRIGGSVDPFVSGRAMFTLADRNIQSCNERHGDGCPTPWDYCCEPKENLQAGTLTVQVVDAEGKPLKTGLSDIHGLKPLVDLIITGKVSAAGQAVVINATGIYLKS